MDFATQEAVLTVALMAAFADGRNDERERDHLKALASSLGGADGGDIARPYPDVLFKRVTL